MWFTCTFEDGVCGFGRWTEFLAAIYQSNRRMCEDVVLISCTEKPTVFDVLM